MLTLKPPLMVTCHLSGGLGNQLFQAAAVFGTLARIRAENRRLAVAQMPLAPDQSQTRKRAYDGPGEMLSRLPRGPLGLSQAEILVHRERNDFAFEPVRLPPDTLRAVALVGYFQSTRYFDLPSAQRAVHEAFQPFPDFAERMRPRAPWFVTADGPLVAIHVRRGDYLTLSQIHFAQPAHYYATAIERMRGALSANGTAAPRWAVFSDDIGWCRANLPLGAGDDVHFVDKAIDEQDALWLMAACDHHIIANSSFSWWGAYLRTLADEAAGGAAQQQVVIAPKQWFAPGYQATLSMADRYAPGWTVI